ncbi:MAG: carboxypeptidase-like regulatory domain-containing protein [Bacteroidaceae bacterium]|nr:carboxypeptidase-like regulatory domain-containing protein [Bacteroidaceae bacterium]
MKKRLSAIMVVCLLPAFLYAQLQEVRARVVDAETGEKMAYVSVYLGEARGTLTNDDGVFQIQASEQDVLVFSYVGYEKQKIKASSLPATIKMKPFVKTLKEVVVTPVEAKEILKEVMRHLSEDYKSHKKTTKGYFVRHLISNAEDSYLVEGFLMACSAVNLRNEAFLSAIGGKNTEGKESIIRLTSTNIHLLTEVGARTYQSTYWRPTIKPLESMRTIRKYYQADIETLFGENGDKLYRITFIWNHKRTESLRNTRYITGTLYVDAKTCRAMSFDGVVNNAYQWVDFFRRPSHIKFHMDYDYTDGYAAVSNLSVNGGNEMMKYRILLFNVSDADLPQDNQVSMGSNTLDAVYRVGTDSTLWTKEIILRTKQEEEIARRRY